MHVQWRAKNLPDIEDTVRLSGCHKSTAPILWGSVRLDNNQYVHISNTEMYNTEVAWGHSNGSQLTKTVPCAGEQTQDHSKMFVRHPLIETAFYAGRLNLCEDFSSVEWMKSMYLCSVISEVSNYNSWQTVHFRVLIQMQFFLVNRSKQISVWF